MEKGLISVIVPVYNVEDYLEKCVDSIRNQTYRNLEILLVDDGSQDGSRALCEKLAGEDKRIHVAARENGGLSAARNTGIERASGEFIGFVDGDDYIDAGMYESLLENLLKEKADIAICGIRDIYQNSRKEPERPGRVAGAPEKFVRLVLDSRFISVNAVNRLYRREMFETIRFPEGKTSEDVFVVLELIGSAKWLVAQTDTPMYNYVHRNGSITTSNYKKSDQNVIEGYEKNYSIVQREYPSALEQAQFRRYWSRFYVLDKMLLSEGEVPRGERDGIVRFLRKNCAGIIKNPYVGRGRKIAAVALRFGIVWYKIFLKYYRRGKKRV